MWKKGNEIFNGRLVIDGRTAFIVGEPPAELMRSVGYEEYTPPAPEPAPERYSKLKIIRALGDKWAAKKAELEAAGVLDEFMAAQYLAEDDPAFAAVLAALSDAEKEILKGCRYE